MILKFQEDITKIPKNTKPINKEKIEEASRNELLALAKMQTKTRYEKAAG